MTLIINFSCASFLSNIEEKNVKKSELIKREAINVLSSSMVISKLVNLILNDTES